MIKDDALYDKLFDAAETIYKYVEHGKGFFSGEIKSDDGSKHASWNRFHGARDVLEKKLQRTLTNEEITMLALAIGNGPTPALNARQRRYSLDYLWPKGYSGTYVDFMKLVTGL